MALWNYHHHCNDDDEIDSIGDSRQGPLLLQQEKTHEIEIYHEHDWPSRCPRFDWIKTGRPSDFYPQTWNALSAHIQTTQLEASVVLLQIYRNFDPIFCAIMFGSVLIFAIPNYFYSCWYFVFLLLALCLVNYNFNTIHREYQTKVYRPSIEKTLQELEAPLEKAGYSVKVVAKLSWGGNGFSYRSILAFTKLEEESGDVEKMAVAE